MSNETPLHAVPLTIEGSWMLHLFWRLDRAAIDASAAEQFARTCGQTGAHVFSIIGNKADLLILLVGESPDAVHEAELKFRKLPFLIPGYSYFSVVELGLYESSLKTYRALAEQGVAPHSEAWDKAIGETLARRGGEQGAAIHELHQFRQQAGRHLAASERLLGVAQLTEQVVDDPVARRLGPAAKRRRLFKIVRQSAVPDQHGGQRVGQLVLVEESPLLLEGQFRAGRANLLLPRVIDRDGHQVGIGKIPAVVGLLLRAQRL